MKWLAKTERKNTGTGKISDQNPNRCHAIIGEITAAKTDGIISKPQVAVGMKPIASLASHSLHRTSAIATNFIR
jgi:hypothetical protein